jgi:hypothetical protein
MATTSNITHASMATKKDFINDEILEMINIILLVFLASAVSLFGIVSNVFNIVIFVKQGLNDTVNVGLMGLAYL